MGQTQLISDLEAAKKLSISQATLYRLRKAGTIRFYRIRGRVFFSQEHLTEFLKEAEQKGEVSSEASSNKLTTKVA